MTESLGRIIAHLAEPSERYPESLVKLINSNCRPPKPVAAKDVYIRAMYVVSDQVNSFGGRFPIDEHEHLASLLVDSPVLVGHRKDKLPVARNFHAQTTERDGQSWVVSYFYWLRTAAGAEDLCNNIDGGIYKECSVAFTFSLPECSLCSKDIRNCEHEPRQSYQAGADRQVCHFNYRRIERVLETSLVYRGANPDTTVTRELANKPDHAIGPDWRKAAARTTRLRNFAQLNPGGRYLIVPRYEGIPLTAKVNDGRLVLNYLDGQPLQNSTIAQLKTNGLTTSKSLYGLLVGYRGKERCRTQQVQDHLTGAKSVVTRLVLNLFPNSEAEHIKPAENKSALDVRIIPHRFATIPELKQKALQITTRSGVELWDDGSDPAVTGGFHYHPHDDQLSPDKQVTLTINQASGQAILRIQDDSGEQLFGIDHFDPARMYQGRRFTARRKSALPVGRNDQEAIVLSGNLLEFENRGDLFSWETEGQLSGKFILRPIIFRGESICLFYRSGDHHEDNHDRHTPSAVIRGR